jgi:ribosomal protein L11 methyltransferase
VIRLAVRVRREQAELVLAELLELAPAGVEERAVGEDEVEYAVYGAPGELPSLPDLRAVAGQALVEISTSELHDDWGERWKRFHRAVLIEAPTRPGEGGAPRALRVRPPWEPPRDTAAPAAGGGAEPAVREIVIDPGQAFGTGAHATTRLCLELLLELAAGEPPAGGLLDVGTGSGVLAIAGALLGYDPVLALDNEGESVAAARENAAANGVAIEVRRFDLRSEPLPARAGARSSPMCVIAANLLRPLLIELAAALEHPPAHLIAGGLLAGEVDEVAAAFAAGAGLRERCRRHRGEWAALWLAAG